jgi:PPOX class probable F420-dependent enzyme
MSNPRRKETDLVYITTFEADDKYGTVPVWFVRDGGKVYITTGPESVKARRIRSNPRVRLNFGRKDGPTMEGVALFCGNETAVRRIVPILNRKYGGYYGNDAGFIKNLLQGKRVMLEVVPDKSD